MLYVLFNILGNYGENLTWKIKGFIEIDRKLNFLILLFDFDFTFMGQSHCDFFNQILSFEHDNYTRITNNKQTVNLLNMNWILWPQKQEWEQNKENYYVLNWFKAGGWFDLKLIVVLK